MLVILMTARSERPRRSSLSPLCVSFALIVRFLPAGISMTPLSASMAVFAAAPFATLAGTNACKRTAHAIGDLH